MNYRRVLNVLGTVALLALVVPFAIYAVPGVIGADHSFIVLSGSMEPEISTGDAVVVDATDPSTIETGDVITFVRGEDQSPVTHRVIGVRESGGELAFETKGDANDGPDSGAVPAENVIGTVVLTIPYIGYVTRFVNTPVGFVALVGLPFGALLVTEVWSFLRPDSENDSGGDESAADVVGLDEGGETGDHHAPGNDPEVVAEATTESTPSTEHAGGADEVPGVIDEIPGDADADGDDPDEVAVDVADLTATVALLTLLTPYAAYVAFTLQTTATITIAFASGFTALAAGGLWLSARFGGDGRRGETNRTAGIDPAGSPGRAEDFQPPPESDARAPDGLSPDGLSSNARSPDAPGGDAENVARGSREAATPPIEPGRAPDRGRSADRESTPANRSDEAVDDSAVTPTASSSNRSGFPVDATETERDEVSR